jgi:hypothetical protein
MKYSLVRKFYKFLFPITSVWIILVYLQLLLLFYIRDESQPSLWFYAFFIPIIIFEFFSSKHFYRQKYNIQESRLGIKFYSSYICNISLWLVAFHYWSYSICTYQDFSLERLYGPYIQYFLFILLQSTPHFSLALILTWLILYWFITIRYTRFRIITAAIIPMLLSLSIILFQVLLGGESGNNPTKITSQKGIFKYLDKEELRRSIITAPKELIKHHFSKKPPLNDISFKVLFTPRGIFVPNTENEFFAFFGHTKDNDSKNVAFPMIVKKSLQSGQLDYVFGRENIRSAASTPCSLVFAPWGTTDIFELSMQDLSIIKQFSSEMWDNWEPQSVVKDVSLDRIYISNEGTPAIFSYDLETKKPIGKLYFREMALAEPGAIAWNLIQSKRTRLLYLTVFPSSYNLFEVDPDSLSVTRKLAFDDIGGTAITIDEHSKKLYYQSGVSNDLYIIDIDSFKVERTIKGQKYSKSIIIDKRRNTIYALSFTLGRIFAINLDNGERLWNITVGGRPDGMMMVNDHIWVNSMAGVFKIDLKMVYENNTR